MIAEDLKAFFSRLPASVTIVTALHDGQAYGFTASSLISVSLDPPLALVCLDRSADCLPAFQNVDRFAVSVLSVAQYSIARRFATKSIDKFDSILAAPGPATGAPIISEATGWAELIKDTVHDGGDHVIIVGRIVNCEIYDKEPLVYHRRRFCQVSPIEA